MARPLQRRKGIWVRRVWSYPGSRKPRLRTVTHFGVQARPLAVDECANFRPACPDNGRGMSPRLGVSQVLRALPVGLHFTGEED